MKKSKISKSKTFYDNKLLFKAIKILTSEKLKELSESKNLLTLSNNPFLYLNFSLNKLPIVDNKRMR